MPCQEVCMDMLRLKDNLSFLSWFSRAESPPCADEALRARGIRQVTKTGYYERPGQLSVST